METILAYWPVLLILDLVLTVNIYFIGKCNGYGEGYKDGYEKAKLGTSIKQIFRKYIANMREE